MLEGDDMHVSQVPADEEQHNVAAEAAGEAAYETPACWIYYGLGPFIYLINYNSMACNCGYYYLYRIGS